MSSFTQALADISGRNSDVTIQSNRSQAITSIGLNQLRVTLILPPVRLILRASSDGKQE